MPPESPMRLDRGHDVDELVDRFAELLAVVMPVSMTAVLCQRTAIAPASAAGPRILAALASGPMRPPSALVQRNGAALRAREIPRARFLHLKWICFLICTM